MQRPWAVGAVWPRQPPAADSRQAPCRRCPIHLQPQCEQCRLARHGVAHCCARGQVGHLAAVTGAVASSRVLRMCLAPPELPLEPPAKRPCLARAPGLAGRRQRPDCRTPSPPARHGPIQSTLPWVGRTPLGPAGAPVGGGRQCQIRVESLSGLGLMGPGGQLSPPPPPRRWHPR